MMAEVVPGLEAYNDWHERERLKYNLAYSGDYRPTVNKAVWKDICKQAPDFIRGLDVGCGPGYGIKYARAKGKDVYGVDISNRLEKTWKRLGINGFCYSSPGDRLPFQDGTFDMVVCTEVMEHIPEDGVGDTLKEIRRVSCGQVYFTIANRAIPDGGTFIDNRIQPHVTVHGRKWWKDKLRESGFTVKETREMATSNFFGCY